MVNECVKRAIVASGLKQKFIAEKLNISDAALSCMVSGVQKIPVEIYFGIAEVIGMDPVKLYHYGEDDPNAA